MSNPQDENKDLYDTLCHPVSHSCHFPLHTLESVRKLTEVFVLLGVVVLVGYITIMYKMLCYVSVVVHK